MMKTMRRMKKMMTTRTMMIMLIMKDKFTTLPIMLGANFLPHTDIVQDHVVNCLLRTCFFFYYFFFVPSSSFTLPKPFFYPADFHHRCELGRSKMRRALFVHKSEVDLFTFS
jgi:hypothetical protein